MATTWCGQSCPVVLVHGFGRQSYVTPGGWHAPEGLIKICVIYSLLGAKRTTSLGVSCFCSRALHAVPSPGWMEGHCPLSLSRWPRVAALPQVWTPVHDPHWLALKLDCFPQRTWKSSGLGLSRNPRDIEGCGGPLLPSATIFWATVIAGQLE
jgi:hypothetical protein